MLDKQVILANTDTDLERLWKESEFKSAINKEQNEKYSYNCCSNLCLHSATVPSSVNTATHAQKGSLWNNVGMSSGRWWRLITQMSVLLAQLIA